MSPVDAVAVTRARERIQRFAARQPEAAKLARFASLAVSVDPPLLRALRLALLPGSDAGIEADLWFSTLTESVSSQGFVLDTSVVEQLRQDLASDVTGGEQRALDRAASITQELHHSWPPSLQLEERVTWLALKRSPGTETTPYLEEVETLLRSMLKTMTEDAARGIEIARWAQRALRRLPPAARETEAALLLAIGAAERLDVPVTASNDDRPDTLSEIATWVLPDGAFKRRTRIGVRRYVDGLEFLEPDQAPMQLEIPKTSPLYLQVSWIADNLRTARMASIDVGRRLEIPANATDIRLQSLAGDEFALESVVTAEGGDHAAVDQSVDITHACVRVDFKGRVSVSASGYFVTRDTILTFWPVSEGERRVGSRCEVTWQDLRLFGTVVAERRPGDEVLVRFPEEIPGAVVLPRDNGSAHVEIGTEWRSAVVMRSPPRSLAGRVSAVDVRLPGLTGDGVDGGLLIALEVFSGSERWREPGLAGAPVVVDGTIVGHVIFSGGREDPEHVFARRSSAVSHFIANALRPAEHQPGVFISYAPHDSYGKGTEIDSAPVDRVVEGIRAAGANPRLDLELNQNPSSAREDVIRAVNASAGGAIIVTPVSHLESDLANLGLQALAYRRWAKADYPLAMFLFRRAGLHGRSGTPPELQRMQGLDIDKASPGDLRNYIATTFGTMARTTDETSGLGAVRQRVETILRKVLDVTGGLPVSKQPRLRGPGAAGDAVTIADDIMKRGVHALTSQWDDLVPFMSGAEARELVQTAAMFSFPAETHAPLLPVVHGQVKSAGFALNSTSTNVAQALINRAWIGQAAPRTMVFREQDRSEFDGPDDVIRRLGHEVAEILDCSEQDSTSLVRTLEVPIFLVFATRPIPSPNYIADLRRALPSASLFFLTGDAESKDSANEILTQMRLPKGTDPRFMIAYERLVDRVGRDRRLEAEPPSRAPQSESPRPIVNGPSPSAPQKSSTVKSSTMKSATAQKVPPKKVQPKTAPPKRASRTRAQKKRSVKKK